MGKGGKVKHPAPLLEIREALKQLIKASSLDISQQLWWVASGFVDAIETGDLSADTSVKSQFARLDSEISRLLEESPASIASDPPDELLRQLLFYIGAVQGAASNGVKKIQEVLDLHKWFSLNDTSYHRLITTSSNLRNLGMEFGGKEFDQVEKLLGDCFAAGANRHDSGRETEIEIQRKLVSLLRRLSGFASELELGSLASLVDAVRSAIVKIDKIGYFSGKKRGGHQNCIGNIIYQEQRC